MPTHKKNPKPFSSQSQRKIMSAKKVDVKYFTINNKWGNLSL